MEFSVRKGQRSSAWSLRRAASFVAQGKFQVKTLVCVLQFFPLVTSQSRGLLEGCGEDCAAGPPLRVFFLVFALRKVCGARVLVAIVCFFRAFSTRKMAPCGMYVM